jgi:hypothetical protein
VLNVPAGKTREIARSSKRGSEYNIKIGNMGPRVGFRLRISDRLLLTQ